MSLLLALAMAGSVRTGVAAQASVRQQPLPAAPAQRASAQQAFRSALGLPFSQSYLDQVKGSLSSHNEYHQLLTASELADLRHRRVVQDAVATVPAHFDADQRSRFAGIWIDQMQHGRATIAFTSLQPRDEALVRSMPQAADMTAVSAQYSKQDLDDKLSKVAAVQSGSTGIRASYRDDATNRLVVEVDPALLDAIRTRLVAAGVSSDAFTLVPTADQPTPSGSNAFSAPPTIGGLSIYRDNNPANGYVTVCSTSFKVKGNQDGQLFYTTAGHCAINGNNSNFPWRVYNNGFYEGPISAYKFDSNHIPDVSLIGISSAQQPKSEIYDQDDIMNDRVYKTSRFGDGADVAGAQTCTSGYAPNYLGSNVSHEGVLCGSIVSNNTTVTYPAGEGWPSVTLRYQRYATIAIDHGYSGGSVFEPTGSYVNNPDGTISYKVVAQGICSGQNDNGGYRREYYSHIEDVEQTTGVTTVTEN